MSKKELSVDEHNADVQKEINKLQEKIDTLKKTFKSESEKKQATLQECLAMNKKAEELKEAVQKKKPTTKSL